jgi:hypothetical protein
MQKRHSEDSFHISFPRHMGHPRCGLVAKRSRVSGYRSRGPGSISDATRISESSGSGTESNQPREYNEELL